MADSRRQAAFIFAKWLQTRDFPATMLPEGPERAFVQDLVYTAIRHQSSLRFMLAQLLKKWPRGEMESLLYIGAAQILEMPSVPDFAAVSATVEAAKLSPNPNVPKTVNAVLRNLIRRRDELETLLSREPLAVRASFPPELVERWRAAFGEDGCARLCEYFNRPAETFLAYPDGTFKPLPHGRKVAEEPGYAEGAFIVQDPGTAVAVRLVDARPGEKILDACAAPGGKTVQLAWRGAQVAACEVNPRRRRQLEENLRRLKLEGKVQVLANIPDYPAGEADKALVDAPCSNTGVLRRRPDARWNWSRAKLAQLKGLQADILDNAARCVKKGGLLVYSTCSLEREENEDQVEAFLKRHPGAELVQAEKSLPFASGVDGAFAAAIKL